MKYQLLTMRQTSRPVRGLFQKYVFIKSEKVPAVHALYTANEMVKIRQIPGTLLNNVITICYFIGISIPK